METVDLNGHIFELHTFTGTVVSISNRVPIFPVTLRADNGREHIITSTDMPAFVCSKGNKLCVVWIEIPKEYTNKMYGVTFPRTREEKYIFYVGMKNYTTNTSSVDKGFFEIFCQSYISLYRIIVFIACMILYGLLAFMVDKIIDIDDGIIGFIVVITGFIFSFVITVNTFKNKDIDHKNNILNQMNKVKSFF